VVFGGLSIAAVFTLFLTPALYLLVCGRVGARNEAGMRLDAELATIRRIPDPGKPHGPPRPQDHRRQPRRSGTSASEAAE